MKNRALFAVLAMAAASMSFASPLNLLNLTTGSYYGAGTWLPTGSYDGYTYGSVQDNGADTLLMGGTGAYTYKLPSSSEGGQVGSYIAATFETGDAPVLINNFEFGGSFRSVVSGGPSNSASTVSMISGVVNVFSEGYDALGGPQFYNSGEAHGPLSNNSYGDYYSDTHAVSLEGLILAPNTVYTVAEVMVSQYAFDRADGDSFTYALTQEYGGLGPSGNGTFAEINYTALPEPASMAALAIGALGLLRRRRKA